MRTAKNFIFQMITFLQQDAHQFVGTFGQFSSSKTSKLKYAGNTNSIFVLMNFVQQYIHIF